MIQGCCWEASLSTAAAATTASTVKLFAPTSRQRAEKGSHSRRPSRASRSRTGSLSYTGAIADNHRMHFCRLAPIHHPTHLSARSAPRPADAVGKVGKAERKWRDCGKVPPVSSGRWKARSAPHDRTRRSRRRLASRGPAAPCRSRCPFPDPRRCGRAPRSGR